MARKKIISDIPKGAKKVLLHTCCAPCSSAIIEYLIKQGIYPVIYYSNSNIYPLGEYEKRKKECMRYAKMTGAGFAEDEYSHSEWLRIAKGLEKEPEKGKRCEECFKFRLVRAAKYASQNGFEVLTTALASSRWKDLEQVNSAGEFACSLFPNVTWWGQNWRKGGLQERRNQIIKEVDFYNQLYCGCEFSLLTSHAIQNNKATLKAINATTQATKIV